MAAALVVGDFFMSRTRTFLFGSAWAPYCSWGWIRVVPSRFGRDGPGAATAAPPIKPTAMRAATSAVGMDKRLCLTIGTTSGSDPTWVVGLLHQGSAAA